MGGLGTGQCTLPAGKTTLYDAAPVSGWSSGVPREGQPRVGTGHLSAGAGGRVRPEERAGGGGEGGWVAGPVAPYGPQQAVWPGGGGVPCIGLPLPPHMAFSFDYFF